LLIGNHPLLISPAPSDKRLLKKKGAGDGNPENSGRESRIAGVRFLNLKSNHLFFSFLMEYIIIANTTKTVTIKYQCII